MTYEQENKVRRGIRLAVIILIAAAVGIILGHLVSSYELRFMLNREYCGTYRGVDIYKSGMLDTDNFSRHAYMLGLAPDELIECCDRMYFTGTDLDIPANDSGYGSALGLTQGRTIYISTESFGRDVVFHELFHAYDNAHDLPSSNSPAFIEAFNEEADKIRFVAGDDSLVRAEYFATAGAIYMVMPESMKVRTPKTYSYFNFLLRLYER